MKTPLVVLAALTVAMLALCQALEAQITVTGIPTASGKTSVRIVDPAAPSVFLNGYVVEYSNGFQGSGLGLLAVVTGGLNVADSAGASFKDVTAAGFNIGSDLRMKQDVELIDHAQATTYLDQLRRIQTVRFRYQWEDEDSHPFKHVGVDAQSLPPELLAPMTETPSDPNSEERLGVSLADWIGLLTVSLQEADRRIAALEAHVAALRGVPIAPPLR